jgi:hypothetical protein
VALGRAQRPGLARFVRVGIAELGDEVVLHAVHAGAVPEVFVRQRADLGDVLGREIRASSITTRPAGRSMYSVRAGSIGRQSAGEDASMICFGLRYGWPAWWPGPWRQAGGRWRAAGGATAWRVPWGWKGPPIVPASAGPGIPGGGIDDG